MIIMVSNRNSVAHNLAELRPSVLILRGIVRNCAEITWLASRNCAQVKSPCVGNPNDNRVEKTAIQLQF